MSSGNITIRPEWMEDEPVQEDPVDDYPRVPRRQVGRVVPEVVEPSFEIVLDGHKVGEVFPLRLTGAAQLDLEDAQTTRQVINWVVTYAGGNAEQVEGLLRPLPLIEVTNFVRQVALALKKSLQLGKQSGPR